MGGAGLVTALLGFTRIKLAAIILGTVGVGVLANVTSAFTLITTVAGLGLQNSAIRKISAVTDAEATSRIGEYSAIIGRIAVTAGILCCIAMILLRHRLSRLTFGTDGTAFQIVLLGVAVILGNAAVAPLAVLQGIRRIGDVAKINIIGATIGTVAAAALYPLFGIEGIVPTLLIAAAGKLGASLYFLKNQGFRNSSVSRSVGLRDGRDMTAFGISLMWGAGMAALVAYVTNVLITSKSGVSSVGLYSASLTLSAALVNFVLHSMATDYYPRLSAAAWDKRRLNTLVNQQTEIGLLLATPCLLATMTFAPWGLRIFYSGKFLSAVTLIQWLALGCFIRVIQWPMGYLQPALGKGRLFVVTQTLLNGLCLFLTWIFLWRFGVEGVAAAFAIYYLIAVFIIKLVANRLTEFKWSTPARRLVIFEAAVIISLFIVERAFGEECATVVGVGITGSNALVNLRCLAIRTELDGSLNVAIGKIPLLKRLIRL
jgi:PST family polysaccharide transporter